MSWKRYLRVVNTPNAPKAPEPEDRSFASGSGISTKYASYLPEVYAGHPQRIQRYYQYDDMDLDSDIGAALDTIADFCTQSEEQNDEPFEIHYLTENANQTEQKIIRECLTKWVYKNDFNSRLWYIFRDVIKNGDAFFVRDPETGVWDWIDHCTVELVKVDTERGKKPEEYVVRGLDINLQAKYATKKTDTTQLRTPYGSS